MTTSHSFGFCLTKGKFPYALYSFNGVSDTVKYKLKWALFPRIRTQPSLYSPPWEPQILQYIILYGVMAGNTEN
jgi:hypothetical protein